MEWGSLGDLRKAAWLGAELWLRREELALASPHSLYGHRSTTVLPLSASISSSMKWEEEMVSLGNGFLWKYSELSPGKTQVWPQGPFSSEPVCSHVCAWALGSLWVGTDVWACDRERWGLL